MNMSESEQHKLFADICNELNLSKRIDYTRIRNGSVVRVDSTVLYSVYGVITDNCDYITVYNGLTKIDIEKDFVKAIHVYKLHKQEG